jgi:hypothetical protein
MIRYARYARYAGYAKVMAVVVALSSACAYVSPPIRLDGRPADLDALVGKWSGAYSGDGPQRRRGSISFTLVAGEDHAHGTC